MAQRWAKLKAFAGFNPWVLIFVGMAIFHLWRESLADVFIFGAGAVLILSQVMGLTKLGFKRQLKFGVLPIAAVVFLSSIVLFVSPRHELANFLTLLSFIPIGIALLLYVDEEVHPIPTISELRGRLVWTLWAGLFAITELIAYLGGKLNGDLTKFPTISVLLDPVLDQPVGRAIFIALWLSAGVYLFGIRRKK